MAQTRTKKRLKVTQMRSAFGTGVRHQACVRGLGLRHLHHSVEVEDTAAVRGMIRTVAYMVKCEEVA